jgi:hypothetical protein
VDLCRYCVLALQLVPDAIHSVLELGTLKNLLWERHRLHVALPVHLEGEATDQRVVDVHPDTILVDLGALVTETSEEGC